MTTQKSEILRARAAKVKQAATKAKHSKQARRQHGFREPRNAIVSYMTALGKFNASLWNEIITELRMAGYYRQDDDRPPIKQVVDRLRVKLYRKVADEAPGIVDTAAERTDSVNAASASRVLGINPRSDSGTAAALDRFRTENVRLITSIPADQLDRVETTISANYGLRVEELSEKLQEQFEVTKSRAQLIARDQTLKLNGQLTKLRQQSAGISEYIWTTSGDERVREDHAALEGTRQSWDVPPVVDEKSGRTANPGEDYQCRCTAYPLIPGIDDEETDDDQESDDA